MEHRLIRSALLAVLLLGGCNGASDDRPSGQDAAGASTPVPPSAPTGSPPSPEGLPADFVVSTNEPFWQARVEGREVVLDGPEVRGRRFVIESDEEARGRRVLSAGDADGRITVRLSQGPCQDSMSGAEFPFTGELELDGAGPAGGCARPAGMPPPRLGGD